MAPGRRPVERRLAPHGADRRPVGPTLGPSLGGAAVSKTAGRGFDSSRARPFSTPDPDHTKEGVTCRRHSRSQAKKLFSGEDLAAQMAGRVWLADRADALVDEIPSAYKDIDQVMADQADLVEVQHTLHQVLNYKGI